MKAELLEYVNQLLAQLDLSSDVAPCRISDLGICQFQLEDVDLTLELISTNARLAITAQLSAHSQSMGWGRSMESHTSLDIAILRSLVKANFLGSRTGGATLFIDPATEELSIGMSLPVEALDSTRLQSILLGMVDQVHGWRPQLRSKDTTPTMPDERHTSWLYV